MDKATNTDNIMNTESENKVKDTKDSVTQTDGKQMIEYQFLIKSLEDLNKNIKTSLEFMMNAETNSFILGFKNNIYATINDYIIHMVEIVIVINSNIRDIIAKFQCYDKTDKNGSEPPALEIYRNVISDPQPALASNPINKTTQTEETPSAAETKIKIIKKGYTDLLKAKIEFDSRFIDFNSVLNQSASSADFQSFKNFCTDSGLLLEQECSALKASSSSKLKRSIGMLENKSLTKRSKKSSRLQVKCSTGRDSSAVLDVDYDQAVG